MIIDLSKPRSVLREFLAKKASGGYLLIGSAVLALIIANSPIAPFYFAWLEVHIGPLSIIHWINDALMALFFLLVGLEIKREFVDGHLATWSSRRLPVIAAAAGMIVPALIYLTVIGADKHLARGWAIPAATDIAFAIAVLALLGSRAPTSLKLFLTTVAIVDDMGAVAVIAIAYTKAISGPALLSALLVIAAMLVANRAGLIRMRWYLGGFARSGALDQSRTGRRGFDAPPDGNVAAKARVLVHRSPLWLGQCRGDIWRGQRLRYIAPRSWPWSLFGQTTGHLHQRLAVRQTGARRQTSGGELAADLRRLAAVRHWFYDEPVYR
jgi:Na+/H+ antiporter 1